MMLVVNFVSLHLFWHIKDGVPEAKLLSQFQ